MQSRNKWVVVYRVDFGITKEPIKLVLNCSNISSFEPIQSPMPGDTNPYTKVKMLCGDGFVVVGGVENLLTEILK